MAQQSVTRVTGLRSGCHHKTFQLVIANINVAARYTRAAPRIHTHDTAVLTRPSGTRARVPGTRTLLFPLSTGWKATGWWRRRVGISMLLRCIVMIPFRRLSTCRFDSLLLRAMSERQCRSRQQVREINAFACFSLCRIALGICLEPGALGTRR